MTSHLDDEGLHPMVSTLLGGGTLPTVPFKAYTRERMMELRTTKASMTRPENLSEDFNGLVVQYAKYNCIKYNFSEDGKFSPLKWLEHRWEIEGIKNRPMSKKIDSLCAGADENTGLSPQRRAFSSGCKAPTDDKGRDGNQLGNTSLIINFIFQESTKDWEGMERTGETEVPVVPINLLREEMTSNHPSYAVSKYNVSCFTKHFSAER